MLNPFSFSFTSDSSKKRALGRWEWVFQILATKREQPPLDLEESVRVLCLHRLYGQPHFFMSRATNFPFSLVISSFL